MSRFFSPRWIAALGTMAAMAVSAQTGPPAPAASGPAPSGQPAAYGSAFEGYQPFATEKVAPWKQSNDTVGRIGAWRAYAKEAQGDPSRNEAAAAPGRGSPSSGHDPHH